MKTLAEKTGGYVVVQEEFEMDIFRDSYLKLFEVNQDRHLKTASNAQLEVFVSKEIKL
jgi:protein transport protein SEC23